MNVRETLKSARDSKLLCLSTCVQIDSIRLIGTKAQGEHKTASIARLEAKYHELQDQIDTMLDQQEKASLLIRKLENPNHRVVLEMYYLGCLNFAQIADMMHYTVRWVINLRDAAIETLERMCEDGTEAD